MSMWHDQEWLLIYNQTFSNVNVPSTETLYWEEFQFKRNSISRLHFETKINRILQLWT